MRGDPGTADSVGSGDMSGITFGAHVDELGATNVALKPPGVTHSKGLLPTVLILLTKDFESHSLPPEGSVSRSTLVSFGPLSLFSTGRL